jgi:putative ABC transport system permease protein
MLGVIIGVSSVVIIVSIGEGVRSQVTGQISQLGDDLITIRPGQLLSRDEAGEVAGVSLIPSPVATVLTQADWETVQKTDGVATASPFNVVSASASIDNQAMPSSLVLGVTPDVPDLLNTTMEFGAFFTESEVGRNVAVIGKTVAEELFGEPAPMGKTVIVNGERFIIRGVFDRFPTSPLTITANTDYNRAVFIPYGGSVALNNGQVQIFQILVKPDESTASSDLAKAVQERLFATHSTQPNFTVLEQEENLAVANEVLTLLTGLISGVAAVSLLVGGIGIMNIMLVAVTERTREIGVRKAVGASNQQIFLQFLTESVLISFAGGFFGILTALFANYLLRITTDLQPIITLPIVGISMTVAVTVGVVFGVAPAMRAARKDPIAALRSE